MVAKILVINDDPEILDSYHMLLEEEGYDVVKHVYLITNLSEIEDIAPDLIILDFMFGRQNLGWNLLQKLKMHRTTANIPVVISTAAQREVTEQLDYLRGKNIPVVLKPFEIDELLIAVRQQLVMHLRPPATGTEVPVIAEEAVTSTSETEGQDV